MPKATVTDAFKALQRDAEKGGLLESAIEKVKGSRGSTDRKHLSDASSAVHGARVEALYERLQPGQVLGVEAKEMVRISQATVGIFSKIVGHKLYLKHGDSGGENGHAKASNNTAVITTRFGDPQIYCRVQDQIARILFKTDPLARKYFVESFSTLMAKLLVPGGVDSKQRDPREAASTDMRVLYNQVQAGIGDLLTTMSAGLEYQRVLSLWSVLYPGSAADIRELLFDEVKCQLAGMDGGASETVSGALVWLLAGGFEIVPDDMSTVPSDSPLRKLTQDSLLRRFAPYVAEAVRRVQGGSYKATLMMTRWLLTKVVDEYIRRLRQEEPPEMPDQQTLAQQMADQQKKMDEALRQAARNPPAQPPQEDGEADPEEGAQDPQGGTSDQQGGPQEGQQQASDQAGGNQGGGSGDGAESPEGGPLNESAGGGGQGGEQDGDAFGLGSLSLGGTQGRQFPAVQATKGQRVQAILDMLRKQGTLGKQIADVVSESLDGTTPGLDNNAVQARAKRLSDEVQGADVKDEGVMEAAIDASRMEMASILDKAKSSMRQQDTQTRDEAVLKGIRAKVIVHTVTTESASQHRMVPDASDMWQAQRLRRLFERALCMKRQRLEESGDIIDIGALVERKTRPGSDVPIFAHNVSGRGFEMLILLDLSGSMSGEKIRQVSRANTMLQAALDFPFARYKVVGFCTQGSSDTTKIVRFPAKMPLDMGPYIDGMTPLHHAVRIAVNELTMSSDATRHLLVLTDGSPTVSAGGKSRKSPQEEIGETVEEARRRGVHTTAMAIGVKGRFDIGEKEMVEMFGRDKRNWGFVSAENLGDSIVELVKHSFQKFLKAT